MSGSVPAPRSAWRVHLLGLTIALAALASLFWDTFASMVEIWSRSDTFAHGYLIGPISAFLIWRRRTALAALVPRVELLPALGLGVLGFGWLLAALVSVQVVEQLMAVLMIPMMAWVLLGRRVVWALAFPLAYLVFAVPFGEGLIQPMMRFTADFLVNALQITGIPVYREGMFLALPSGNWSIVEGCSGVRYLIASTALGFLYAYLTYRSLWRRASFVALAVLVPIFANGMRAYIIVMIGHLSEMKYATGADHLIYGWVFFGAVMLVLFWIGGFWREDEEDAGDAGRGGPPAPGATAGVSRPAAATAIAVLVAAMWPAWAYAIEQRAAAGAVAVSVPEPIQGWSRSDALMTEWRPQFQNPSGEGHASYDREGVRVGFHVAYYGVQRQGAELVNSQNVMIHQKHPVWHERYLRTVDSGVEGLGATVWESRLKSSQEDWIVWHWYWIGGRHTVNRYEAKVREALAKLTGGSVVGAGIVVFAHGTEEAEDVRGRLRSFIRDMLPAIEQSLEDAGRPLRAVASRS